MKYKTLTYYLLFALMLLAFSSTGFGQYVNLTEERDNNKSSVSMKPQVSLGISTGFTSYAPGINMFATTIAPRITFPVSPRFTLGTGVGYSTVFMNQANPFSGGPTSYGHLFVSGDYLLNERVRLKGTAYSTFSLSKPNLEESFNSPGYDFSSKGVTIDVEYKVTENFRINVGMHYRDQSYPLYYDGFGSPINGIGNGFPTMNFDNHHHFRNF